MLPLFDNVPTRRFALVTYSLIATNFLVWFWELGSSGDTIAHDAFYPCALWGPCTANAAGHLAWPAGLIAGMFLHASWLHILGNMLFLWIFGNNVEDTLGRFRFLVFYLAAGIVAGLAQTVVTVVAAGAAAASVPNVGASGAIAGVLGAYLVLLPRARVVTLVLGFLPVPIPAVLFLLFWFAFQIWDGGLALTHPASGGGVAFFAHVGGFLFGALTIRSLQVRAPLEPRRRRLFRRRRGST